MTGVTLYANTDLVVVAFLKAILGWTGNVGTDLPGPPPAGGAPSWADTGFVQVISGVGGSSDIFAPQKNPVVGIKCYATTPDGRRPPWAQANNLAEAIRAGCFAAYRDPVAVTLPPGYPNAVVQTAYLRSEPRRFPGDPSNYAVFGMDLQVNWITVGGAL